MASKERIRILAGGGLALLGVFGLAYGLSRYKGDVQAAEATGDGKVAVAEANCDIAVTQANVDAAGQFQSQIDQLNDDNKASYVALETDRNNWKKSSDDWGQRALADEAQASQAVGTLQAQLNDSYSLISGMGTELAVISGTATSFASTVEAHATQYICVKRATKTPTPRFTRTPTLTLSRTATGTIEIKLSDTPKPGDTATSTVPAPTETQSASTPTPLATFTRTPEGAITLTSVASPTPRPEDTPTSAPTQPPVSTHETAEPTETGLAATPSLTPEPHNTETTPVPSPTVFPSVTPIFDALRNAVRHVFR